MREGRREQHLINEELSDSPSIGIGTRIEGQAGGDSRRRRERNNMDDTATREELGGVAFDVRGSVRKIDDFMLFSFGITLLLLLKGNYFACWPSKERTRRLRARCPSASRR